MSTNAKLREFAALIRSTAALPELEREHALMKFVQGRDKSPAGCGRLSADDEGLWSEARAIVTVSLFASVSSSEELSAEQRKNAQALLDRLVPELAGEVPNLQAKRWRDGVERRVLQGLGPAPWTKARAREVCKGLKEPDDPGDRHANEHLQFYIELADRVEAQGTGE